MSWTQEEINECIEQCRKKATVDTAFRALLLSDVAAAVKELSGKDIPESLKIKIVESDPAYNATFVLPPMESGDVSDSELDDIAGGICGMNTCAMNACAAKASGK